MIDFIRSLFESALKTNPFLEFAVITGCLRISKESIFTGLNNLKTLTITNAQFDEYFGFTDKEVKEMLCEPLCLCISYVCMPKKERTNCTLRVVFSEDDWRRIESNCA